MSTFGTWTEFAKHCPQIIIILCYFFQLVSMRKIFLKQTVIQVLSTAQNAHFKLMTFSYPENFLRAETNKINTSAISVRSEKMQSLLKKKTTDGIGCTFKCTWVYEKQNPLGTSGDTEKALFLFQRLVELEKSKPFKDTVISFIELLQKGIGRFTLSEHSRTLDIDLGVSNAQCTCFECLSQPLHLIGSTTQEANNYSPTTFFCLWRGYN